jgi:hypothetical protein
MITTELKLPFPFYASRKRQHRFRKNCKGEFPSGLITPNDALLPFQIRIETDEAPVIDSIEVFSCDALLTDEVLTDEFDVPLTDENDVPLTTGDFVGTPSFNLNTDIGLLEIVAHNSGYNIIYQGFALSAELPCGLFEVKISFADGSSYWSELFRVVGFGSGSLPFTSLSWKNTKDLQKIKYETGFENKIYLDTFVSHSEPVIQEDVEKDGIETEIVIFVRQFDRFIFSEVVPDFLKTAIVASAVCREVVFLDPNSGVSIKATRIRTTSAPEGNQCFSFIEVQVEVENELFRTSCE